MSVNEKMTAIADAIREKTETTDLLTLDEMATAIENLEVGGMDMATGTFVRDTDTNSYGQFFLGGIGTVEDLGVNVTHNLGKIPKIAILLSETRPLLSGVTVQNTEAALCYKINNTYNQFIVGLYTSSNTRTWLTGTLDITTPKNNLNNNHIGSFCNATENEIFITCGGNNAGNKLMGGSTYRWFLWG